MPKVPDNQVEQFMQLHSGLPTAYGTGKGEWVDASPSHSVFKDHLEGKGAGVGIGPLRPDSTVMFAAIDLDEPDFLAAREMQGYIPGASHVERSRSGNAHIFVYFSAPIEAYIPMGILKEATRAAGKKHVEVFPKNHDFEKVKYGSYINLPFHGTERPTLEVVPTEIYPTDQTIKLDAHHCFADQWLSRFLEGATNSLNDPEKWRSRARWLLIEPPERRENQAEFGAQPNLHICADHLIDGRDENPVAAGHRSVVYFSLAKMLTNWQLCDHDEAAVYMRLVNEASPDRVDDSELMRILGNAERGGFTSTGCDDPLFAPYAHPNCKIAQGG